MIILAVTFFLMHTINSNKFDLFYMKQHDNKHINI